jgi:Uma2 family endonuclease
MVDPAILPAGEIRPLRRLEYDCLVELGTFEDERLELLGGMLVVREPQGALHAGILGWLSSTLIPRLVDRATVRIQSPIALSDVSEPEPDVAVVPLGDYRDAHPDRALLIIEVADSSVRKDRKIKAPLYASAGVPEYWVVDLPDKSLEVHRSPSGDTYQDVTAYRRGDVVFPVSFPELRLQVSEIFG